MSSGRSSNSIRITGLSVLLFAQVVLVILIYGLFERSKQKQFDAALYNHANDMAQEIYTDPFGKFSLKNDILSRRGKILPFSTGQALIQVLKADGTVVARSGQLSRSGLPLSSEDLQAVSREGPVFRTLGKKDLPEEFAEKHSSYRLVNYFFTDQLLGGSERYILQVAVPMKFSDGSLLNLLLLAVPFTLIVAAPFFPWFERRIPIRSESLG